MVEFAERITHAFRTIGVPLSDTHGVASQELEQAERRLGISLPDSLRQYYALAGQHPINTAHNELFRSHQLSVEGNVLVFMNENQSVVLWGIAVNRLAVDDPPVLQAPLTARLEWYPEDPSLQNFLLLMLHWQAVEGGLPFVAVGRRPTFEVGPTWSPIARVHEMTAYNRPNTALCVVRSGDTAQVHLGSTEADAIDAVSAELDLEWDYSNLDDVPRR